ncbi:MAG: CHAT domain-containing protein [Leptolyngbyaceae cyanobacterium RU_5_1]|nr:CHAT domain-containing protein [Leptolyngbyaceae cyanobacterium RU_5_1]
MHKLVVIHLGSGDLSQGFPRVTVQLWESGHRLPEQFTGSAPPAPHLADLYRHWQAIYQSLCDRQRILVRSASVTQLARISGSVAEMDATDDHLDIDQSGITHVSQVSFEEICQQLQASLNRYLQSEGIFKISRHLRSRLDPSTEVRVILETTDDLMRRLPWQRCEFYDDYPNAELALSQPEYKRRNPIAAKAPRKHVRILAILGSSQGIDLNAERQFLEDLPDAETVFLVQPARQELNTQLWDAAGWDMLFFAGHSQTEGETGRLYLNDHPTHNSLTLEQLGEALKAAIDRGLKLAIFNSCDGLGLAAALEKFNIPVVIVMREPVPNRVAQTFFQQFLQAFAVERLSLYLSVQQARRQLQGLEDDFPGASWLPIICQNPAVEAPTWVQLGGVLPCPYRGLFAFQEDDAPLFFGRERVIQTLVAAVNHHSLVAVIGPSGSGKSSVVFAGLVPQLRQDAPRPWHILSFRPGNDPFEALAVALLPHLLAQPTAHRPRSTEIDRRLAELELAIALRDSPTAFCETIAQILSGHSSSLPDVPSMWRSGPPTRLMLIVDQFEELYTQTPESDQQPFLDQLLEAVRSAPAFTLVLTLRADFYGYALSYRPWSDALQGAVQNLGPMNREELQAAIAQPAAHRQVKLEDGLTQRLIDDLWEQPGGLPLLEFALTQLWAKQQQGWLTHQAYTEIGGVASALANHAEATYAQLAAVDRLRAQRLFMQLVRLGEETKATRRLATRDEIQDANWDLVMQLADARLVVTNRHESSQSETVEIVHEALIRSWERLAQWMQADGDFRRWQEQLRTARRQWQQSGQDDGSLLHGKSLTDAVDWEQNRAIDLSSGDLDFIQQSLALRDRELQKLQRRRQLTLLGLITGLVGALALTGITLGQWRNSVIGEIQVLSASSEATFTTNHELEALQDAIRAGQTLKQLGFIPTATEPLVSQALNHLLSRIQESNRLAGHQSGVNAVVFSPDGQTIATGSEDNTVRLWQANGRLLKTLTRHTTRGKCDRPLAPSGQLLATGSKDGTINLWQANGTWLQTLNSNHGFVNGIMFSPDGQVLVAAYGDSLHEQGVVQLWTRAGHLQKTLTGKIGVQMAVAFSPDGQTIASGGWEGDLNLWQNGTLIQQHQTAHQGSTNAIAFSPDGQLIATASSDHTVRLWNKHVTPKSVPLTTVTGHSDVVWSISFSHSPLLGTKPGIATPDHELFIATASQDRTVKLWRTDGTLVTSFVGHGDGVRAVAFSPDNRGIATASQDKTIKLWNLSDRPVKALEGHGSAVYSVAFSPDSQQIATASQDQTVKLWTRQGMLQTELKGDHRHYDQIYAVAYSPNGNMIATASGEAIAKLWRRDGTFLKDLKGHTGEVRSISFSPNGHLIVTSDDRTIKLWKSNGTFLKNLKADTDEIHAVVFSPDSERIAIASDDHTVKLINLDGLLIHTLKGHTDAVKGVAFSPDGSLIATASNDHTVKLWAPDGTFLTTLQGHTEAVNGVAFSPDSQYIATASDDHTVKLWNRDGTFLKDLKAHSDVVWDVTFSPDGQTIATASKDKTAILWNWQLPLNLDSLLTQACAWERDYLTTNPQVNEGDRHLCS